MTQQMTAEERIERARQAEQSLPMFEQVYSDVRDEGMKRLLDEGLSAEQALDARAFVMALDKCREKWLYYIRTGKSDLARAQEVNHGR